MNAPQPARPHPAMGTDGPPADDGPAVFIADEQDDMPVEITRWQNLAHAALVSEGVRIDAELTVLFVSEAAISDLNRRFMSAEGSTDVLSFPIDGTHARDDPRPVSVGVTSVDVGGDRPTVLLGDVVICPVVAERNAVMHAGTYDDEIALLLVHGILHLLGHDHADDAERAIMQERERALLLAHHGPPTRDPWES